MVEDSFGLKLETLASSGMAETSLSEALAAPAASASSSSSTASSSSASSGAQEKHSSASPDPDQSPAVDKSVLALPAPRRYRNRDHLRFVMRQPCLICGRKPSDPHHLRHIQPRALGRKASDEFAVPLCRIHHRLVHRAGNETAWWQEAGIDPIAAARKLWRRTRRTEGPQAAAIELDEQPQLPRQTDDRAPALQTGGGQAKPA